MSKFNYTHIGISTNLFNNPKDILGTVKRLSQNFSVIEVELDNGARELLKADAATYDSTVAAIDELRKFQGLYLSVHAPYIGPDCDISANDEDIRQVSCNLLRQAIKFCADIGGERLTYHPGYLSLLPLHHMMENLMRSLDELVPEASDQGVKMCLENTGGDRPRFLVFSPEQHMELSQKTGTRLTVDLIHHASHFTEDGKVGDLFFEKLAVMMPYIENVHIADMIAPKHVHLPVGQGTLPVAKLLDFLGEQNYHGNAIIEELGGGFSGDEFVEQARQFRDRYRDEIATKIAVTV